MADIPLSNGRYADAAAVSSTPDLRVIGQKDTFHGKAHLWLDNRQHTWRRVVDGASIAPVSGTVQVNVGRADARVQAEWFSTATGLPNNTQNLTADAAGVVTLTVTSLATDTAVKLSTLGGSVAPGPGDWSQHQRDAARTGRADTAVPPPFRARWIWAGPARTLRNRDSQPGWPDDLSARPGYTYPNLPSNSGVTLAQSVQPIVAAGRVFVGSLEGAAFALGADDGATLWQRALPGPTISSAAVVGGRVAFACITGEVVALDAAAGTQVWLYDAGRAITGAPCAVDGRILVGTQDGRVHALEAATGAVAWVSEKLGPSIHGGLAAADGRVFTVTEDMRVHALSLADGSSLATRQVRGQSFRLLWPVVHGGRVWIGTITTPIIGSEYIGEANTGSSLFADSPTLAAEQANILRWLAGDTNGGRWPDAGADWRRLYALNVADLSEPFVVPAAPADGVGLPVHPPVLDHAGRVLSYFKTRHPTLTVANGGVFGTAFSVDISAVDPATGLRSPIDNGHLATPWPWETDNLYAMSTAGTQLWLRQNFRGTQVIDLATSTARGVSAEIRNRDGGTFNFDVVYKDSGNPIGRPQPTALGRSAPVIVGGRVFIAEDWGVTAIEHRP
jgi:outer membrane protein assembly factor BamB